MPILTLVFLLVVVGGVIDLILDRPETMLSFHVGFEVMMVLLSLGAATYLARGWYSTQSRLTASVQESARLSRERQEWKDQAADLLAGLGSEISHQFEAWALTPTDYRRAR